DGVGSYQSSTTLNKRVFVGNYPRRMIVYKISYSKTEQYTIRYHTPHVKENESFVDNVYQFDGHVGDNKQQFRTAFKVVTDGAKSYENGVLTIDEASSVVIYHTAATDYTLDYPLYKGNDYKSIVESRFEKIDGLSYKE